jgi:hypothetical protein
VFDKRFTSNLDLLRRISVGGKRFVSYELAPHLNSFRWRIGAKLPIINVAKPGNPADKCMYTLNSAVDA